MRVAAAQHRGWSGPVMVVLAGAGIAIAAYLSLVKLGGGSPACVVVAGCDAVNNSEYSVFMGVPVAVFGLIGSVLTFVAAAAWWRRRSRRGLLIAYLLGLAALPVLGYLTYLELFVIHAICIWCVAYAVTVISGWLVATAALMRRAAPDTAGGD